MKKLQALEEILMNDSNFSLDDKKWLINSIKTLIDIGITKEELEVLREGLGYMDGDSWFCETVPKLLDVLDAIYTKIEDLDK